MKNSGLLQIALMGMAGIAATGCASTKSSTASSPQVELSANRVNVSISLPAEVKPGGPLMLTFSVDNLTKKDIRFLKWNTPFESFFAADYLTLLDASGQKVEYRGAMAKRMWPPPTAAYANLKAGAGTRASIDISKAYPISKAGKYTILFDGQQGDDALPASNTATFTVK